MNRPFATLIVLAFYGATSAQGNLSFADSIRIKYHIPELAYAVVSSDSIFEIQSLGVQRVNSNLRANISDKFRIGSNSKTITSFISTLLVKQEKIKWDTKFFDLYPELKAKSNSAYYGLTLKDLLTFRAPLIKWSYDNEQPTEKEIKGNNQQQRYEFISWILRQNPVTEKQITYWSNPAYVAAGLMIEKVTGKSYETLVEELGKELGIQFGFGQPNVSDINQPWGHNENSEPEKPGLNYKLNWLSSAGNINVSLPDYCTFIQLQLKGLSGRSNLLTQQEFVYMHYGLPEFSFGWKWYVDDITKFTYSFHEGNPGTFLTKVFLCKNTNKAFIVFTNIQSNEANTGLTILLEGLKKKYGS